MKAFTLYIFYYNSFSSSGERSLHIIETHFVFAICISTQFSTDCNAHNLIPILNICLLDKNLKLRSFSHIYIEFVYTYADEFRLRNLVNAMQNADC